MNLMEFVVLTFSALFTAAGFASLLRFSPWWIRMFDFPRLQISVLLVAVLIAGIIVYSFDMLWHYIAITAVCSSLLFELSKIIRYTFFVRKQVKNYSGNDKENTISIIVSNVLQSNRNSAKLMRLVEELKPDMLFTLESDGWWEEQLETLKDSYPFSIKKPQDNLYGMHLYSRLTLKETEIAHLVEDEIPSFEALVELKSKQMVRIYCLHPKPPFPAESDSSINRDAELLIVAKKVKAKKDPVLIFGDFNDVAWSHTTTLFQNMGGLLDPRIGRGFYNMFHAQHPLFRWPLDHIFHSTHFKLIKMKRLDDIGSDHFPIYVHLHFAPLEEHRQVAPKVDDEEKKQAEEKIEEAL
jgi:endonuclease/exonuclease/phosphatase (EEP) superfamily protein YafD